MYVLYLKQMQVIYLPLTVANGLENFHFQKEFFVKLKVITDIYV